MKKHFVLVLLTLFIATGAWAQTTSPGGTAPQCTCNPNNWKIGSATVNGVSQSVNCGHQFALKCNEKITIQQNYSCIGGCAAQLKAVLKNNTTGAVVMTYANFTTPWSYAFTAAGNYSLEISAICGNTTCTPTCRYFFTVTCPAPPVCDCYIDGWSAFTATIGANAPSTVKCGHQFGLKPTEKFSLKGIYKCKGTCAAKYEAKLINQATGALVANYPNFNFTWLYSFAAVGSYKLEITPLCGNKRCQPCTFYFTVR
jgi:hypothetical protein